MPVNSKATSNFKKSGGTNSSHATKGSVMALSQKEFEELIGVEKHIKRRDRVSTRIMSMHVRGTF